MKNVSIFGAIIILYNKSSIAKEHKEKKRLRKGKRY